VAIPILGLSPFLAGGYVLAWAVISRRGRFTRWLYGYAGGLTELDPDGRPRTLRWDDGIVAALAPAEVGEAIPRFPSVAGLITDQAVTRVVARQVTAVRSGGAVVRGDLRVTRDGIAGPKDEVVTPWAAIERIELRPGRVKVRPIGGKARKYDNYRDGSGFAVLCRLLLALGVNASYEARG
jgi:hypothetical protein